MNLEKKLCLGNSCLGGFAFEGELDKLGMFKTALSYE